MRFLEKLAQAIDKNRSLLCVGLDPDPGLMPPGLGVFEFNRAIIDATADLVCAYKPNIAFYEALGRDGWDTLKLTRDYIAADIPVIVDAKRGDIGNTARAYARGLFDYFRFDATTASPYLGLDSLEPFIAYHDRGVFILCRTSNAGAADFQSLSCETETGVKALFEVVAGKVALWNKHGNLGLVVGATYPEELRLIRQGYPEMPLLIPGVGTQGGELADTVRFGVDAGRCKTIINSSRQVLYASKGKDFAAAARIAAGELRGRINEILAGSPS
ncbi:MAG: orotidine 5'-phosphate decarboxylase [Chloroflexi bacterium RBG_16_56_11]|nr:MAG: orotidine 5'-phosphate decarboxylase [Chloroflexi bacterium RBG_16_56_11]